MIRLSTTASAAALALALAGPAFAQQTEADIEEADRAAEEMMGAIYVYDTVEFRRPSEVIQRLRDIGYTDIDEFDVEYGQYEVEATTPDGDDVELEIDPITGAILEIEEDWF